MLVLCFALILYIISTYTKYKIPAVCFPEIFWKIFRGIFVRKCYITIHISHSE